MEKAEERRQRLKQHLAEAVENSQSLSVARQAPEDALWWRDTNEAARPPRHLEDRAKGSSPLSPGTVRQASASARSKLN